MISNYYNKKQNTKFLQDIKQIFNFDNVDLNKNGLSNYDQYTLVSNYLNDLYIRNYFYILSDYDDDTIDNLVISSKENLLNYLNKITITKYITKYIKEFDIQKMYDNLPEPYKNIISLQKIKMLFIGFSVFIINLDFKTNNYDNNDNDHN